MNSEPTARLPLRPPLLAATLATAWLICQLTDAGLAASLVAGAALGIAAAAAPVFDRARALAVALATTATLTGVVVIVVWHPTGPVAAAWMVGAPLAAAPVAPLLYALTGGRRRGDGPR